MIGRQQSSINKLLHRVMLILSIFWENAINLAEELRGMKGRQQSSINKLLHRVMLLLRIIWDIAMNRA